MSTTIMITIICDANMPSGLGCEHSRSFGHEWTKGSVAIARRLAGFEGWRRGENKEDICPSHKKGD